MNLTRGEKNMFDFYPETIPKDDAGYNALCGPRSIALHPKPGYPASINNLISGPYPSTNTYFGHSEPDFFFRATDADTPTGRWYFGVKVTYERFEYVPIKDSADPFLDF
jgi:hypothetical protein